MRIIVNEILNEGHIQKDDLTIVVLDGKIFNKKKSDKYLFRYYNLQIIKMKKIFSLFIIFFILSTGSLNSKTLPPGSPNACQQIY